MILETERIFLKPFSIDLVNAALTNDYELYKKTGIIPNQEWPEKDLKEALPFFKSELIRNGITGFGSWIITSKHDEIIGSAGFIGEPDNGTIEIGFGIIPSKRKMGYCKESILELVNWAINKRQVKRIIAHCDIDNIESNKVLTSCKFLQVGIANGLIEWDYRGICT